MNQALLPRKDTAFWWPAILLGTLVQFSLYAALPLLSSRTPPQAEPEYIVVDFLTWREPRPVPKTKKADTAKPKPKPKPKPQKKPKQVIPVVKPDPVPAPKQKADFSTEESLRPEVAQAPLQPTPAPEPEPEPVQTEPQPSPEPALPTPVPYFELSELPRYAHEAEGIYPPAMRALGKEAVVRLEVLIDRKGNVRKITVTKSQGETFDQAAVDKIRNSSFLPAKRNGTPVPVLYKTRVNFKLR